MAQKVKNSNSSNRKKIECIYATQIKTQPVLQLTFLLAEGGAFLFCPPTTEADLFTTAKVNYKSSIYNVPLKPLPSIAFRPLLQCLAPLLASSCWQ
jgi:hypothetical protein